MSSPSMLGTAEAAKATTDESGEPVSFVNHDRIVPNQIEARAFQVNLGVVASQRPSLVVVPTGLGKTVIGLLVMADRLARAPNEKIVILAPTKPLVEQHRRFLAEHLRFPDDHPVDADTRIVVFSGDTPPDDRARQWKDASVIVATPQVIENDLIANRYHLMDVSLVIFDEAHRATGDYSYVWLSEQYGRDRPDGHRLGLTASPGSSAEKIVEVCQNLSLHHMEIRTEHDEDVRPYIHQLDMDWVKVPLPAPLKDVAGALQKAIQQRVQALKALGVLKGASSRPTRRELLALAGEIQSRIRLSDDPDRSLFDAMSLQAQALKIHHALELVETQGAAGFLAYWDRLKNEAAGRGASKATNMILADDRLQDAVRKATVSQADDPKLERVVDAVRTELTVSNDPRIIVFTNYRDTCVRTAERLAKLPGCRPVRFVGQASREGDKGLTQKAQKELVQAFRDGEHNVLVATSVAEEGLDIPQTDLVVFYEPVASEIRAIQRRGRTARHRKGRVIVLMYADTRDEAYYWASTRRERSMRRELRAMQTIVSRELGRRTGADTPPVKTPRPEKALDVTGGNGTQPPTSPAQVQEPDQSIPPQRPERAKDNSHATPGGETQSTKSNLVPQTDQPQTMEPGPDAERSPLRERPDTQATLRGYFGKPTGRDGGVTILVDHRESRSGVVKALATRGVNVQTAQLSIADYVLSDRVAVERKNVEDFLSSLMDGRLFQQAKQLTGHLRPMLIVEGEGLTRSRNLPRASIFGALAALTTDFGITVLQTNDVNETADLLVTIAKREQTEVRRQAPVRLDKVSMSDADRRRFIIEGLPNVSAVLARRLLAHFGTVEAIMRADEDELCSVDGVGRKTAREIRRILTESNDAA